MNTGVSFLKQLNARNAAKRESSRQFGKITEQSATKVESEHLHGINVTRMGELWKHSPARFEKELERRVAWQNADRATRTEIMNAIERVG